MNKNLTYETLEAKIRTYLEDAETLDKIEEAYHYLCEVIQNEKDHAALLEHAFRVCETLTELNVDSDTLIAALLNVIPDYSEEEIQEIENKFGNDVARIIDNLAKIEKLELTDSSENSAIYLRKVMVGLSEDVRVIIIKLADRLDHMNTTWVSNPEKMKGKALETEEVLIPIAHRLGINSLKSKLEDAVLRYTKPEVYRDIETRLSNSREELENLIVEMKESIAEILKEHGIKFEIKGRVKSIYSIYKKLDKGKKWNDIYDILALRVFVDKVSDCYSVIGFIHSKYRPVPNRFKDYIAMPKENMYQSLHTTVFGIDGHLFEVQVRTYEMDEIAEKGIASHWSYKEHGTKKIQAIMEQKLEMFRNIIEANADETNDSTFAENINREFLSDYIYVFTPKGDVVELPKGATPIDFAYRIHSKVGDHTVNAIVNEQIVPLDYELQDKDIIKINTNPTATPSKEWLKFAKTSQAKGKIKSYFSKKDKEMYLAKGKEMLERELRKRKMSVSESLTGANLEKVLNDLHLGNIEELYLAVGSLRFTSVYVINLLTEDKKEIEDILLEKMQNHTPKKDNSTSSILVDEKGDIKVSIASCCKPIFGEEIVGYITKGKGVVVHKKDCKMIAEESDRMVPVSWNKASEEVSRTDLRIETYDTTNHLLDLLTVASVKNNTFEKVNTITKESHIIYEVTVKVNNLEELNALVRELEKQPYIMKIERNHVVL